MSCCCSLPQLQRISSRNLSCSRLQKTVEYFSFKSHHHFPSRSIVLRSKVSDNESNEADDSPLLRDSILEVDIAPHLQELVASSKSSEEDNASKSLIEKNLQKRRDRLKNKTQKETDAATSQQLNTSNIGPPADTSKVTKSYSTRSNNTVLASKSIKEKVQEKWDKWNMVLPGVLEWYWGPDGVSLEGTGKKLEALMAWKIFSEDMFQGIDFRLTDKKIVDNVLDNDQIALAFSIFLGNGLVAIGELIGDDADAAQKEFQMKIDQKLPGLACLITRINPKGFFEFDDPKEAEAIEGIEDLPDSLVAVIIMPAHELVTFSLPRNFYSTISVLLSAASGFFMFQVPQINPLSGESSPWMALMCSLSLLFVAGSSHFGRFLAARFYNSEKVLNFPVLLPSPLVGCFGSFSFTKGCFPNKAAVMDVSFASVLGSLGASAVLLLLGSLGNLEDLSHLIFVNENVFFLVPWLKILAVDSSALVLTEGNEFLMALNPLTFSGLVGVQLSIFNLLPIGTSDGGRLFRALGLSLGKLKLSIKPIDGAELLLSFKGKDWLLLSIFIGEVLMVTYRAFQTEDLWLLQFWLVYAIPLLFRKDWFQYDEVSDPGLFRSAFGAWLVALASLSLLL